MPCGSDILIQRGDWIAILHDLRETASINKIYNLICSSIPLQAKLSIISVLRNGFVAEFVGRPRSTICHRCIVGIAAGVLRTILLSATFSFSWGELHLELKKNHCRHRYIYKAVQVQNLDPTYQKCS